MRPKDGRDSFALWCDLAGIPQGWKRALMGHQAENVTQEYGWQESERILEDAEVKLRALLACPSDGGQTGGHPTGKSRKCNAPRRTRTPSLLIRSHLNGDSTRHAATRAVIPRRTRPAVYRNRRAASRSARGTPTFTPTAYCEIAARRPQGPWSSSPVGYLTDPLDVTEDVLELAGPVTPTEVFRFRCSLYGWSMSALPRDYLSSSDANGPTSPIRYGLALKRALMGHQAENVTQEYGFRTRIWMALPL